MKTKLVTDNNGEGDDDDDGPNLMGHVLGEM